MLRRVWLLSPMVLMLRSPSSCHPPTLGLIEPSAARGIVARSPLSPSCKTQRHTRKARNMYVELPWSVAELLRVHHDHNDIIF